MSDISIALGLAVTKELLEDRARSQCFLSFSELRLALESAGAIRSDASHSDSFEATMIALQLFYEVEVRQGTNTSLVALVVSSETGSRGPYPFLAFGYSTAKHISPKQKLDGWKKAIEEIWSSHANLGANAESQQGNVADHLNFDQDASVSHNFTNQFTSVLQTPPRQHFDSFGRENASYETLDGAIVAASNFATRARQRGWAAHVWIYECEESSHFHFGLVLGAQSFENLVD